MPKENKSLDAKVTNPENDHTNSVFTRVFCPRCGGFNIYKHRIFTYKYVCNDCGYKWH